MRVDGEERAITSYQFALLLALAERAGRVLSRDALMDLLKGEKLEAFDRSVDVHISRIRAAIEDDPKKPRRILTVRGAGYVFAAQDQDPAKAMQRLYLQFYLTILVVLAVFVAPRRCCGGSPKTRRARRNISRSRPN